MLAFSTTSPLQRSVILDSRDAYADIRPQHTRTVHSSTHCRSCDRHFGSIHLLQDHYTKSAYHPSCPRCSLGFIDDDDLNEVRTKNMYLLNAADICS
jgi:hypothetical protein